MDFLVSTFELEAAADLVYVQVHIRGLTTFSNFAPISSTGDIVKNKSLF